MEFIMGILGTAFLGICGWAVSMNSRVSVLEQRHEDLITFLDDRFDMVNANIEGVTDRLASIEDKL